MTNDIIGGRVYYQAWFDKVNLKRRSAYLQVILDQHDHSPKRELVVRIDGQRLGVRIPKLGSLRVNHFRYEGNDLVFYNTRQARVLSVTEDMQPTDVLLFNHVDALIPVIHQYTVVEIWSGDRILQCVGPFTHDALPDSPRTETIVTT